MEKHIMTFTSNETVENAKTLYVTTVHILMLLKFFFSEFRDLFKSQKRSL